MYTIAEEVGYGTFVTILEHLRASQLRKAADGDYSDLRNLMLETKRNPLHDRLRLGVTSPSYCFRLPMESAKQIVPVSHIRTANRQAAMARPSPVRNLRELHAAIEGNAVEGYTISHDGERLLSFLCPNFGTLIVTTRRMLSLLPQAQMLHADATYETVPLSFCQQLFSIHGNWQGHVAMALCAFMTESSADAYREVFKILKRETNADILRAYMGDFDAAMRAAVRAEFPNARLYGCLFHYAQALVRRASGPKVGLAADLRTPGEILKKFVALTALPLLPANAIRPIFAVLSQEALEATSKFEPLLRYMEAYWLGTIGANELSLFGAPCRTNNGVESFHALLKAEVRSHPSVWNLIAALNNIAQDSAINVSIRFDGIRRVASTPNRATKENERIIREASGRLRNGMIHARQFIDDVKYRVGGAAVRHGLADGHGSLTAEVAGNWDEWVNERVALQPKLTSVPTWPPLGDHGYAKATAIGDRLNPQIPALTDEIGNVIEEALSGPPDQVLVEVSRLIVTRRDLETLVGFEWLNDVIINVYLNLIVERSRTSSHLPRIYAFNTFFLKLYMSDMGYEAVRQWTRGDDIFGHDMLLVPVHSRMHWSMIVVDLRQKRIEHMDSMNGRNEECLEALLEYLAHELADKKKCRFDCHQWTREYVQNLPQQENGYDCGVFALKFADYGALRARINFSQKDMPYFRRRM
ncbi:uncharacterized protein LOC100907563, partial [Galendromus occidentalis]|uniref:Uncharacterized protein LOC100907563 n=1 Tax=Galendromus occidentalis TaxID=34638 RepID=A0AAJ6VX63_9ACAR